MGFVHTLLVGILSSLIIFHIISIVKILDVNKAAYNHEPGPCKVVNGIEYGSEDIQALPNGLAFISSGITTPEMIEIEAAKRKGQIFLFDFNNPNDKPRSLPITGNNFNYKDFNPHGISLWQDSQTKKVTLFVINHLPNEDHVEKFAYDSASSTLQHLQSIASPAFRNTNDLVALSENTFYITNFFYYRNNLPEALLRLKWGSVVYYDGQQGHTVLTGLDGPNGINKLDKHLYFTTPNDKHIHVYNIEKDFNLSLLQTKWLATNCDNIDFSRTTKEMWIGCHPVAHKFVFGGYIQEPSKYYTPSQVLRIKLLDNGLLDNTITEVYSDDGLKHSASSVAVNYKDAMLIGSVFTKLLFCNITYL